MQNKCGRVATIEARLRSRITHRQCVLFLHEVEPAHHPSDGIGAQKSRGESSSLSRRP